MDKPAIAIFGAAGFVGSALCERLYLQEGPCFRALIRTVGNAARIARFPISIEKLDLLDFDRVQRAISGCDFVVNCTLGFDAAMHRGLENVLRAAKEQRIRKFIHLSSIAIYGEDPSPDCGSEDAIPTPTNVYGKSKLIQDDMVLKLHRAGIPSIILCPGHIIGPYSPFVIGAAQSLRANELVLVDDGQHPTNQVHVDNLVEAIFIALAADVEKGWGERYFVTDPGRPVWKQFYSDLCRFLGLPFEPGSVSRQEVVRAIFNKPRRPRFSDNLRVLASAEFRRSLYQVPIVESAHQWARRCVASLGPRMESRIRATLRGRASQREEQVRLDLAKRYIAVQVRRPYFSAAKISNCLGYRPILTSQAGMETIRAWFTFMNTPGPVGRKSAT